MPGTGATDSAGCHAGLTQPGSSGRAAGAQDSTVHGVKMLIYFPPKPLEYISPQLLEM